MIVILHLSDLHRSASDPVKNSELLAALESDRLRWREIVEPGPDLVVVSGDVVRGADLGEANHHQVLDGQYADAEALLVPFLRGSSRAIGAESSSSQATMTSTGTVPATPWSASRMMSSRR